MTSKKIQKHTKRPAKPVVAASVKAAASMLDVPVSMLKMAKAQGAEGFRPNGNVCITELSAWLETNDVEMDKKTALECRRLEAQCKRLEFGYLVDQGQYTSNEDNRAAGIRICSNVMTSLSRLRADAPTWEGLPAPEIEKRVDTVIEQIRSDLHGQLAKHTR